MTAATSGLSARRTRGRSALPTPTDLGPAPRAEAPLPPGQPLPPQPQHPASGPPTGTLFSRTCITPGSK
jgi:hypothetical protein